MKKIVECVPNYSIGNEREKLDEIVKPFKSDPEIKLISVEPDDDYNRTVVTVIGEVEAIITAMVNSCRVARDLINLTRHKGQHKRMGAVDVVPLIPIRDISVEETVAYSERLAEQIYQATDIPIYLYSLSAKQENRRNLPDIRQGEFEGMFEKIRLPEWLPDYGQNCHPTAGVTAVGCRPLLVAYNIDLNTAEKTIAAAIAKTIRFSSGGYRYIQAGPAELASRNIVQVTMNVTDYQQTAVYRAFEAVKMEAKRYKVEVIGSEFIGLVSLDCLKDIAAYYLGLPDRSTGDLSNGEIIKVVKDNLLLREFDETKVIENYL